MAHKRNTIAPYFGILKVQTTRTWTYSPRSRTSVLTSVSSIRSGREAVIA